MFLPQRTPDYLQDGLTAQGESIFDKNPKGYALYLYQSSAYGKTYGLSKWNELADFFYKHKKDFSYIEICRMLHQNPISFILRIIGLRMIYRLYR